jgi:hypothetical protein
MCPKISKHNKTATKNEDKEKTHPFGWQKAKKAQSS